MGLEIAKTKLAPVVKQVAQKGREVITQLASKPDTFTSTTKAVKTAEKTGFFQKLGQKVMSGVHTIAEKIKTHNLDLFGQAAKEVIEKGSKTNQQFTPLLEKITSGPLKMSDLRNIKEAIKGLPAKAKIAMDKAIGELEIKITELMTRHDIQEVAKITSKKAPEVITGSLKSDAVNKNIQTIHKLISESLR